MEIGKNELNDVPKKQINKASNKIGKVINDWHAKWNKGVFKKKSNENFYTVYTYLDKVLKDNKAHNFNNYK